MTLMPITMLTPIRDEKQIIQRWEERKVLLNPRNIESVGYVEEIGKAQLLLTSGRCVPVWETLDRIAELFEEATY